MTDTDVSIERVNLALYDSYVVAGPSLTIFGARSRVCRIKHGCIGP